MRARVLKHWVGKEEELKEIWIPVLALMDKLTMVDIRLWNKCEEEERSEEFFEIPKFVGHPVLYKWSMCCGALSNVSQSSSEVTSLVPLLLKYAQMWCYFQTWKGNFLDFNQKSKSHKIYYLSIFCIINTFIYCYETILLTVITLFNTKHLVNHTKT